MGKLDGQVAVITGGASGIGAATVRLFAAEGARVVVADMQEDKGQEMAQELGDQGAFVQVNVTQEAEVKAAIDTAVERWGRLDCIYNNAGFGGALGPIESISVEDYDMTFDVLLKGVFLGIKHAAPIMKKQQSGSIISTSSAAGVEAGMATHLYSVAKAGVIHLTKSVALELGEFNIRANCICPGAIVTPLAVGRPSPTDKQVAGLRKGAAHLHPLGRVGEPEEIAKAALWLASDDASFVTGQALAVDGGITAGRPWRDLPEFHRTSHPIRMYRVPGK